MAQLDSESKEIELTQGKVALVDDEDFESLMQWSWCFDGRYAVRGENRNGKFYMHREILKPFPKGIVDHINGDKLDNRRSNLREVDKSKNAANSAASRGTSIYRGVSFDSQTRKWRAQLVVNKKRVNIGYFATPEEAARAYDNAAHKFYGEFARVNFP